MAGAHTQFQLHPTLATDTVCLGDLPLCRVLLARESRYPWLILVPRRAGIREIYELEDEAATLLAESCSVARLMQASLMPDKLNIASIGNVWISCTCTMWPVFMRMPPGRSPFGVCCRPSPIRMKPW